MRASSPASSGLPAPAASYTQFGPTVSESCRLYYVSFAPNVASTIDLIVH
jgi:hypothetical protein